MKKHLFSIIILLCCLLLYSCRYHGSLNQDFYQSQVTHLSQVNLSIAIKDNVPIKPVIFPGGLSSNNTIDIKENLLKALNISLNSIFKQVERTSEISTPGKFDYIVVPKHHSSGRIDILMEMDLLFYDADTNELIKQYSSRRIVNYRDPESSIMLGFCTGFTLFLVSPVTIPLITKFSGDHAVKLVEAEISNSLDDILQDISMDAKKVFYAHKHKTMQSIQALAVKKEPPNRKPSASYKIPDLDNIDFGNYHALIIGNNDYKNIIKLKTAAEDAKAVADILRELYGFNVKLMLNGTRQSILSALDNLRSTLKPHDNLLIYYAGHGYYDEDAERGYWLPIEAQKTTTADWISNADITDKLKALKAKHVMIVADSCYSGTLTRGIDIRLKSPDYISRIAQKRARTVLTSGGMEPVLDSGGDKHSVFAKAFLDALEENANIMDGTILFSKIRRPVMINSLQTPQYSDIRFAGHRGGDFIFVRKK